MLRNKEKFIIIIFIVNSVCSLAVAVDWWLFNLNNLNTLIVLFSLILLFCNFIIFIFLLVNKKIKQIFILLATFFITGLALTILFLVSWLDIPTTRDFEPSIVMSNIELPDYSNWLTFDSIKDAGLTVHFTMIYPNDFVWEKGEGGSINFYQQKVNGDLVKKFMIIVAPVGQSGRVYDNLNEQQKISIDGYQGIARLGIVPEDANPDLYFSVPGKVERNDVIEDVNGTRFELVFTEASILRNSIIHNIEFDF